MYGGFGQIKDFDPWIVWRETNHQTLYCEIKIVKKRKMYPQGVLYSILIYVYYCSSVYSHHHTYMCRMLLGSLHAAIVMDFITQQAS